MKSGDVACESLDLSEHNIAQQKLFCLKSSSEAVIVEKDSFIIWDFIADNKRIIKSDSSISAVTVDYDAHALIAGHGNGDVTMWDLNTLSITRRLAVSKQMITDIHISLSTLVVTDSYKNIVMISTKSGEMLKNNYEKRVQLNCVVFDGSSTYMAASFDNGVKIYRLTDLKEVDSINGLPGISKMVFVKENEEDPLLLIVGSSDDGLGIWEIPSGKCS